MTTMQNNATLHLHIYISCEFQDEFVSEFKELLIAIQISHTFEHNTLYRHDIVLIRHLKGNKSEDKLKEACLNCYQTNILYVRVTK